MATPLLAYLAGIGSVVVALSAGFAGGALVGASFGTKERPEIVARTENPPLLVMQPREIARVQAAALERASDDAKAAMANATKAANDRKIAAERKASDRRKIARAERREEHNKQIAIAAARKELDAKAQADVVTPTFAYAPVASSQVPPGSF